MDGLTHIQLRSAGDVRARIGAAMLGDLPRIAPQLGAIQLRHRQRVAAERLVVLLRAHGGALLAEAVGVGKTFTAIAVAGAFGNRATVVAPAALRAMWLDALRDCGIEGSVLTHERLSRMSSFACLPGLLIVDEAHRFRSPSSKRYATLAASLGRSPLLLLSATPIQNRDGDLAALLALFAGRRAWTMSDEARARFVVRTSDDPRSLELPRINGPLPIALETVDDCLDLIVALPPPVAARDESIAATLLRYGLVHQWASSRAALVAALERRRSRGFALLAALGAGRAPTRAELSAWTHGGDGLQLAFPELVVAAPSGEEDPDALAIGIDRHTAGVDALLAHCRRTPDPDDERARLLTHLLAIHRGERIIAFAQYSETVSALRRRLAAVPGIAALTARGGWIASGRCSRRAILAQFEPSRDRAAVNPAERIDLLLATDLLSEGLNLQEASVVVHLDLPWNPAKLDQRVGRVRRLGARHSVVTVYSFAPPARAERMLAIEQRLRDKLSVAARTIGVAGGILPSFVTTPRSPADQGLAEQTGEIDRMLREWRTTSSGEPDPSVTNTILVASVGRSAEQLPACAVAGFLAVVRERGAPRLIADIGAGVANDPRTIREAVVRATALDRAPTDRLIRGALERVYAYLQSSRGRASIDFAAAASARSRRAALGRIAQTLARAPRYRRAALVQLADAARTAATAPLGEGGERVLELLARADLPDEAWLRSLAAFGEANARAVATAPVGDVELFAMIVWSDDP